MIRMLFPCRCARFDFIAAAASTRNCVSAPFSSSPAEEKETEGGGLDLVAAASFSLLPNLIREIRPGYFGRRSAGGSGRPRRIRRGRSAAATALQAAAIAVPAASRIPPL